MLVMNDTIALCATSQAMFKLASSVIARDIRMSSGLWAGGQLAIMCRDSASLPQAFLQDDLAYRSVPNPDHDPYGTGVLKRSASLGPAQDYLYSAWRVYTPGTSAAPREWTMYISIIKAVMAMSDHAIPLRPERREPGYPLLDSVLRRTSLRCVFDDPVNGRHYYLRNHTIYALVRLCDCEVPHISAHTKESNTTRSALDGYKPPSSLDEIFAMMTRYCTLKRPSNSALLSGVWTIGQWAGHKFDIVTAERHAREYTPTQSSRTQSHIQSSSELPNNHPIPPIQWRDITSALCTRASWEHERLKAFDGIATIGKPDSCKRHTPKWALDARKDMRLMWLSYMDSIFPAVMAGLEADADRHEDDLPGKWRRKFAAIILECARARDPKVKGKAPKGMRKEIGEGRVKQMKKRISPRGQTDVRRSKRLLDRHN